MSAEHIYAAARSFILRNKLISKGDRVLASVSGGQDSLCMLLILNELSREVGFKLFVFHLDHLTRGGESSADAIWVKRLCESLGLVCVVESVDASAFAKSAKLSFQVAARVLRLSRMLSVARSLRANRIATGHTSTDQVETVLLRFLRGTSLRGLAGMAAVSGPFIKPILCLTREQTLEYCSSLGYLPRTDRTNLESNYDRNKVRNIVIPAIEQSFQRNISPAVLRLADMAREDSAALDQISWEFYRRISQADNGKVILFSHDLEKLPGAVAKRVLWLAIEDARGYFEAVDWSLLGEILRRAAESRGLSFYHLPGGLVVSVDHGRIEVGGTEPEALSRGEASIPIEGQVYLPGWDMEISTKVVDRCQLADIPKGRREAAVDLEKLDLPLVVREWKPGDKMVPFGLLGKKKLHDIFVDEKVPKKLRALIPVVCDKSKVVWLVGYRIDERVKIAKDTRKVLVISVRGAPWIDGAWSCDWGRSN